MTSSSANHLINLWRGLSQTQIKENIKAPRHWPLCGEFTGDRWIPAQMASNAENVSILWRHHVQSWCNFTPRKPSLKLPSSATDGHGQINDSFVKHRTQRMTGWWFSYICIVMACSERQQSNHCVLVNTKKKHLKKNHGMKTLYKHDETYINWTRKVYRLQVGQILLSLCCNKPPWWSRTSWHFKGQEKLTHFWL